MGGVVPAVEADIDPADERARPLGGPLHHRALLVVGAEVPHSGVEDRLGARADQCGTEVEVVLGRQGGHPGPAHRKRGELRAVQERADDDTVGVELQQPVQDPRCARGRRAQQLLGREPPAGEQHPVTDAQRVQPRGQRVVVPLAVDEEEHQVVQGEGGGAEGAHLGVGEQPVLGYDALHGRVFECRAHLVQLLHRQGADVVDDLGLGDAEHLDLEPGHRAGGLVAVVAVGPELGQTVRVPVEQGDLYLLHGRVVAVPGPRDAVLVLCDRFQQRVAGEERGGQHPGSPSPRWGRLRVVRQSAAVAGAATAGSRRAVEAVARIGRCLLAGRRWRR